MVCQQLLAAVVVLVAPELLAVAVLAVAAAAFVLAAVVAVATDCRASSFDSYTSVAFEIDSIENSDACHNFDTFDS